MEINQPYIREADDLVEKLETDRERGLSKEEAQRRLKKYGRNVLEEKEKVSLLHILLDQLNTPVVYLLAAAAALSFAFGDIPEGTFIVVVILVNTAIGFWMERQAHLSMKALREMDRVRSRAIRDGEQEMIDAEELVPGDLLVLEAGDLIAADGRLVEASDLEVNESALTGESLPVGKNAEPVEEDTALADRTGMVYKGTAVTRGRGRVLVTATGDDTEVGRISELVQSAHGEDIPLDKKLHKLTKVLIWIVLGMAALLGLASTVTGQDLYTIVQTSIAWAIAAIPEGLPIVASIALARGMLRLADHQVIVKHLSAVEALGETNVIFTDKTGTLTQNRLTVNVIVQPESDEFEIDEPRQANGEWQENALRRHLFRIIVLANDAGYEAEDNQGDPLDIALRRFTRQLDAETADTLHKLERIAEDPFDAEDKVMGAVYRTDGHYYYAGKGAAGAILERSSRILDADGQTHELDEEKRRKWEEKNDELSGKGLKALAFAYKESEEAPPKDEAEANFLHDLTFVGLIGFIDPPRQEVAEAIDTCHAAGIKVVMLTGDHPGTAANIAHRLHLVDDAGAANLSSIELEERSDEEIVQTRIFSRISPEEKLRIVEKFQEAGNTVGMTGDGVNDAPALKKADIGIAMGRHGTQVAKETADLVLKDDNFSSIVEAIREGRIVFSNIRKFIVYQLSYHLGEVFVIAVASFTVYKLALLPLQLLFLNLLTDVFPALALGIGKGREAMMKQAPKPPEEPILHRPSWVSIVVYAVLIAAWVSGAYLWGRFQWNLSFEICNNIAFFSLAFAQLLHVFNMRDHDEPFFNNQVTRNKFVWMALALCLALLLLAYFVPALSELLSFQSMGAREWLLIVGVSIASVLSIQGVKSIFKLF